VVPKDVRAGASLGPSTFCIDQIPILFGVVHMHDTFCGPRIKVISLEGVSIDNKINLW
jgi:hypothetical protein